MKQRKLQFPKRRKPRKMLKGFIICVLIVCSGVMLAMLIEDITNKMMRK